MTQIHIPAGINFDCSGCGNCCLTWPVPVTADDVSRISALAPAADFRALNRTEDKLKVFTHALGKRPDGRCQFLSEESRCSLHEEHGSEMKPAMCRLFPYTFMLTPSGVYASLSFASSAVLFNSGRALNEQAELLEQKWQLFSALFPQLKVDWTHTQLADGVSLTWDEYLQLDAEFQRLLNLPGKRIEQKLGLCSLHARQALPPNYNPERQPHLNAGAKLVDQILLRHLYELYLPDNVFACDRSDLDVDGLMQELVHPPAAVKFKFQDRQFTFKQILDTHLGNLDAQCEDLLFRFIYCRIFAKLYFGFGLGNFSVLVGLHHLLTLMVVIRLQIKMLLLADAGKVELVQVAEVVRTVERRLTQIHFSVKSQTALEVLLCSPQRMERFVSLAV